MVGIQITRTVIFIILLLKLPEKKLSCSYSWLQYIRWLHSKPFCEIFLNITHYYHNNILHRNNNNSYLLIIQIFLSLKLPLVLETASQNDLKPFNISKQLFQIIIWTLIGATFVVRVHYITFTANFFPSVKTTASIHVFFKDHICIKLCFLKGILSHQSSFWYHLGTCQNG